MIVFEIFSRGYRGIIARCALSRKPFALVTKRTFVSITFYSDEQSWRANHRAALHILRDFGFGRRLMEEKIVRQTRWLLSAVEKCSGETYCMFENLELAVGNVSLSFTKTDTTTQEV